MNMGSMLCIGSIACIESVACAHEKVIVKTKKNVQTMCFKYFIINFVCSKTKVFQQNYKVSNTLYNHPVLGPLNSGSSLIAFSSKAILLNKPSATCCAAEVKIFTEG